MVYKNIFWVTTVESQLYVSQFWVLLVRPIDIVSSRILCMASNGRLFSLVRPSQFYVQSFDPDLDVQPRFHCVHTLPHWRCIRLVSVRSQVSFVLGARIELIVFLMVTKVHKPVFYENKSIKKNCKMEKKKNRVLRKQCRVSRAWSNGPRENYALLCIEL